MDRPLVIEKKRLNFEKKSAGKEEEPEYAAAKE